MAGQTALTELTLLVAETADLTPSIRRLRLVSANGSPLPSAQPGGHLKFSMPISGPNGQRCYSLVTASGYGDGYEIAVHLAPDSLGGSRHMHGLKCGDHLLALGPQNDFSLCPTAKKSILIAGGIGITPLLSMAHDLAQAQANFVLHYVAREVELMAYRAEAEALGARLYFDEGNPQKGIDLAGLLAAPQPGTHVYVCGPRPMIDATIAIAATNGWPREQIHFELFTNGTTKTENGFEVELKRSGDRLHVGPEESILDALIKAGHDPMFDCRRGECSACVLTALEGEIEHHDYCLSEDDRADGQICICVSRARGKLLVLDA